jgi:hypothetical protein
VSTYFWGEGRGSCAGEGVVFLKLMLFSFSS